MNSTTIGFVARQSLLLFLATSTSFLAGAAQGATCAPFLILTGSGPGVSFGHSISAAGDVNGDGFQDLIVGELGAGQPPLVSGCAYVFLGGPGASSTPALTLTSSGSLDAFGEEVSAAGDLNGDGFADLAVGAPYYGPLREVDWGRAYVYYGRPALDAIPDLRVTGARFPDHLGASIAPAGDVNGDGFSDLIVSTRGKALVYFGGSPTDSVPDLELTGVSVTSVSPAGDVNGDGFDDLLVSGDYSQAGRAYVYYGAPQPDPVPAIGIVGAPGEAFGWSISKAGDFNGDGFGDVVVGAPFNSTVGSEQGRAFIYFGGPSADAEPDVVLNGSSPYDRFGSSLASADVNGDGVSDVIVGAPQYPLAAGTGRVYVFFGGPHPDSLADVILEGEVPSSAFGESVTAGDMNGDGIADVIVGAPSYGCPPGVPCSPPGRVYVYDLAAPLPSRAFLRDGHRTIPLVQAPARIIIQFEAVYGSYDPADVDPASIRLVSDGAGETGAISPVASRSSIVADTDGNGVAELSACFMRSDLARLFSDVRGRRSVDAALEGSLTTGRRFRAHLELTILGVPGLAHGIVAAVSPNPLNPQGKVTFSTTRSGYARVTLFDIHGRLLRTLLDERDLSPGPHTARIDGSDESGTRLGSGVYFYKIETPEGETQGRFVVLK